MKRHGQSAIIVVLAVLALLCLSTAAYAQDENKDNDKDKEKSAYHGMIDFGVRYATGDVYGRPDLEAGPPACLGCGTAFDPVLKTSKFNEYRDLRNGVYGHIGLHYDAEKNHLDFNADEMGYRDQKYELDGGRWGGFTYHLGYEEIPHNFSFGNGPSERGKISVR